MYVPVLFMFLDQKASWHRAFMTLQMQKKNWASAKHNTCIRACVCSSHENDRERYSDKMMYRHAYQSCIIMPRKKTIKKKNFLTKKTASPINFNIVLYVNKTFLKSSATETISFNSHSVYFTLFQQKKTRATKGIAFQSIYVDKIEVI